MENPLYWISRELGKSSREWTAKHWAAYIGVVAAGVLMIAVMLA